jgi:hypothetical protein
MNSTVSDEELAEKVRLEGDNSAIKELYTRHLAIFRSERRKLPDELQRDILDEDFYLIIWKSCDSFRPDRKVKFSTWLFAQTKFARMTSFKKFESRTHNLVHVDDDFLGGVPLERSEEAHEEALAIVKKELSAESDNRLTRRANKVLKLRYLSGGKKPMTFEKIAKNVGLSIWGTVIVHNKALEVLKDKVKKGLQS